MLHADRLHDGIPKDWERIVKGITPFLSYEPVRQTPRPDLVKAIRNYVKSGLKPQREIAKEIGLSRTKMSQFMNNAKRVKGWTDVEAKLDHWIKEFRKSKQIALRFIETFYEAKPGKPDRPVVENVYKRSKSWPQSDIRPSLDPQPLEYFQTCINACRTSDTDASKYQTFTLQDEEFYDLDSPSGKQDDEDEWTSSSFEQEEGWVSFEIAKALNM